MKPPTSSIAPPSLTPVATDRFQLGVTFEMAGIDWNYVNALHAQYKFHERWPAGMLCHITGEFDGGIRSAGLWTDVIDEQKYFRQTAVPVITDSIMAMGPAVSDEETIDFEPVSREVMHLCLTRLANSFADIGADEDASAVHALGGQPVAVRLHISEGVTALGDEVDGLVVAWTERDGERPVETQVWSSADHAERAGALAHAGLTEMNPLRRISFGPAELGQTGL